MARDKLDPRRKEESLVFASVFAREEHKTAPVPADSCQKRTLMSLLGTFRRPGRAARSSGRRRFASQR